ncbi:DUF4381 domain-containing protein [Edaphobacter sp. HDX4]|uniref:DUF4381 domain-containing protein n=1 Tax=Edaphobacter sp. HDX4 TaxID=2794064 RepID=UPI002FE559A9
MRAPLDSLHNFYQPPPPSWRPQTIGWYAVFGIIALLLLWLAVRLLRRWRENRYRREALSELATVDVTQLSALLKRTALSAWPREEVAALSGPAWLRFLDGTVHAPLFENAPENCIEEIAFSAPPLSSEDEVALRNAAGAWIKHHKPPRQPRRPHVST